jgi:phosphohistidine phosphatase
MHLYLIRHAAAASLDEAGVEGDAERPLTEAGRKQCPRVAQALRRLGVKLEYLLTSPLLRAKQTAEGIVGAWGEGAPAVTLCEELAPGNKKRKLVREVLALGAESVALVGHNPDLSELVGWLIGDKGVSIDLAKAGVACIEFQGSPGKGSGTLAWMVNPAWYCDESAGPAP